MRPAYWSMMWDIVRFYKTAPRDAPDLGLTTLEEYLDAKGYGSSFRRNHLYPMAAAIWSTPAAEVSHFPARAFIRFFDNHGLLNLGVRPAWKTVEGGSRQYIDKLTRSFEDGIRVGCGVNSIHRQPGSVVLKDSKGRVETFDHVVIATHADKALQMIAAPTNAERETARRVSLHRERGRAALRRQRDAEAAARHGRAGTMPPPAPANAAKTCR